MSSLRFTVRLKREGVGKSIIPRYYSERLPFWNITKKACTVRKINNFSMGFVHTILIHGEGLPAINKLHKLQNLG